MKHISKRQKLEIIRAQLENEASSFKAQWRDLGDYILPTRPRFVISDANKGTRKNQKIIDSTGTLAARTLRSGMMGGITSPARPWFRLTTQDPKQAETGAIKEWLHTVTQRMQTVFLRSNLYNVLPVVYGDLGIFGTAAMSVEQDMDSVIRCTAFPIGSYRIAANSKGTVDVFFREFRMTVRQVIDKFAKPAPNGDPDFSNLSDFIKAQWENKHLEAWVDICHCIKPNDEYDPSMAAAKFKRFGSYYYEKGIAGGKGYLNDHDKEKFLRESGFDQFPILVPRWEISGGDVYGTSCPGMTAIGDIKQLQVMQKRKAQAVEKMVNPPMVGPTALKKQKASLLPGDITYHDERDGSKGFRPVHEVNARVGELTADIQDTRQTIQRAMYEDLFLMLSQSDRRQITAREIDERREEKLLALGPVLEQLNQDLLDPLIDVTFSMMDSQEMIPEPPEQLQGQDLKVEYISVMAQAQKLVGISGIERFLGFVGQVAAADPSALDKMNTDQLIDEYGDLTSIPPGLVRSDDEVEEIRAQRAQAQQAAQQAAAAQQMAGAAKDLSQTSMEGDNALTKMMNDANAGNVVPGI